MKRVSYTLVEMLVVVAVVALLLTVATPAFNRIAKGNALQQESRLLAGKISACRAYAVENRCYVALLFPTATELDGIANNKEYYNACYRPAIVYKNGTNFKFVSWIKDESWSTMQAGVIIPGTNVENCGLGEEDSEKGASGFGYTIQDVNLTDLTGSEPEVTKNIARAIVFKNNGQLYTAGNVLYPIIRLVKGVYDGSNFICIDKLEGGSLYSILKVNPFSTKVQFTDSVDTIDWASNK